MYSIYPCQEETLRAGGGDWRGTCIIPTASLSKVLFFLGLIPVNGWTMEVLGDADLQLNQAMMVAFFSRTENGCSHRYYQMPGITAPCNARCIWVIPM